MDRFKDLIAQYRHLIPSGPFVPSAQILTETLHLTMPRQDKEARAADAAPSINGEYVTYTAVYTLNPFGIKRIEARLGPSPPQEVMEAEIKRIEAQLKADFLNPFARINGSEKTR